MLAVNDNMIAKSTEKLSSGYRINRAADDAAGLTISEKMRGQIRGLNRAADNAQDGISLIQTAEGALNEITSVLQRMRELTVQAANDTNVSTDRAAIAAELYQLASEITRISTQTEFNTMKLLDGTFTSKHLQVGANTSQQIRVNIGCMTAASLGLWNSRSKNHIGDVEIEKYNPVDENGPKKQAIANAYFNGKNVSTISQIVNAYSTATVYITVVDCALNQVSSMRSNLGALQNRLDHTIANADNVAENLTAAESRIRDIDMAEEMVTYSKYNILQQAGQSMLAQANQATQGVLSLLR
jgi:flagellin